jgi:glutathione synthase/RimK-type ligase-like ATP-grasp enzyme
VDALCRDKVACQRALEAAGLALPPVEDDPERFEGKLGEWGAGFLKPRFGGLGAGVRRVAPGDALPRELPGATGVLEPSILQRAVPPWSGAACALRMLVQRSEQGWHVAPIVARISDSDPVANVERGAHAVPAIDHLPADSVRVARALAVATAAALADPWTVELGVDAVVDRAGQVWLIEVNGRPKGRLEVLAHTHPERFAQAHLDACLRPLLWLHFKIGLDTPRVGI